MKVIKQKSFQYEVVLKELRWYLFGRKICPSCRGKLVRYKPDEAKIEAASKSTAQEVSVPNAPVKLLQYHYMCQSCRNQYTLEQLAQKK